MTGYEGPRITAMARKGAYLILCAAMDKHEPVCATFGEFWEGMRPELKVAKCKECPLIKPCRAYAEIDPANTWGVWGGRRYPRTPKGNPRGEDE